MQDTSQRKVANNPSKMWQSSDVCERHEQMNLAFKKKFRSRFNSGNAYCVITCSAFRDMKA